VVQIRCHLLKKNRLKEAIKYESTEGSFEIQYLTFEIQYRKFEIHYPN